MELPACCVALSPRALDRLGGGVETLNRCVAFPDRGLAFALGRVAFLHRGIAGLCSRPQLASKPFRLLRVSPRLGVRVVEGPVHDNYPRRRLLDEDSYSRSRACEQYQHESRARREKSDITSRQNTYREGEGHNFMQLPTELLRLGNGKHHRAPSKPSVS